MKNRILIASMCVLVTSSFCGCDLFEPSLDSDVDSLKSRLKRSAELDDLLLLALISPMSTECNLFQQIQQHSKSNQSVVAQHWLSKNNWGCIKDISEVLPHMQRWAELDVGNAGAAMALSGLLLSQKDETNAITWMQIAAQRDFISDGMLETVNYINTGLTHHLGISSVTHQQGIPSLAITYSHGNTTAFAEKCYENVTETITEQWRRLCIKALFPGFKNASTMLVSEITQKLIFSHLEQLAPVPSDKLIQLWEREYSSAARDEWFKQVVGAYYADEYNSQTEATEHWYKIHRAGSTPEKLLTAIEMTHLSADFYQRWINLLQQTHSEWQSAIALAEDYRQQGYEVEHAPQQPPLEVFLELESLVQSL